MKQKCQNYRNGFTMIELLVVITIIALLMSVLLPSLGKAKQLARTVVCRTNLHSLAMANIAYASDHDDCMVLAASDINSSNLKRWHGVRDTMDDPFDYLRSPLISYIGDGSVKKCPEKVDFRHGDPWDWDFEDGCGGYGYNMTYLGSRIWAESWNACNKPTKLTEVRLPSEKLMFADTAMAKNNADGTPYYLEYSFAEAPYFASNNKVQTSWGYASPSLHFRHNDAVNIVWADGHVGPETMVKYDNNNAYGVNSASMMLGWFRVLNNAHFQVK
jgi:prepilin-type N-terminal cleavage/methylation domain-containing protein/prepilin-type processing-associated H-X9-DG protein